jgi:hypothetical protein
MGDVSPDGKWYWTGQEWVSTASPDGTWRWNGQAWVASGLTTVRHPTTGVFRNVPGLRSGAVWKLPVAAIAGLFLIGAINSAIAPPATSPAGKSVAQVGSSPTQPVARASASPSQAATASPSPSPSPQPSPSPSPIASPTHAAAVAPPVPPPAPDPYAAAKAAGATAVCADGTWSYSKTRSGTCSHHGGVHWWTGNLGPAGPGAH